MICPAPPPNRILAMIARTRQRFMEGVMLGDFTVERLSVISKAFNLTPRQYGELRQLLDYSCICQAALAGNLSHDEADTLCDILGYSVNHFNRQSIAVKSVVIREFGDLPLPFMPTF